MNDKNKQLIKLPITGLVFSAEALCADPARAADPNGASRRPPSSMHARQELWGAACVDPGMELQSPIQLITKKFSTRGEPFRVERLVAHADLIDTGHTFQLRFGPAALGAMMDFEGEKFALRQFHFHKPSEHLLDGKQFEMEIHFVFLNQNPKGARKAVALGFLITEGVENAALRAAWKKLPPLREGYGEGGKKLVDWQPGDSSHELHPDQVPHSEKILARNVKINVRSLIPPKGEFMVYEGSLTTPGCEEGITHATSTTKLSLGHDQIERFGGYYEGSNRDLQPAGKPALRKYRRSSMVE